MYKLKGEPVNLPARIKKIISPQEDTYGSRGSLDLKHKLKSQITAIKKSMK